ncbi:uncharacterized protein PgNI_02867 [Pyricularia grisea]|uniref:Uncharacterized protein n=1 Tax=Pyricularia grisea TaxID=148305 RepID=A0A6P8BAU6_PYRGI|nr:uncharacterized protein PgNI_02867 [Pyricularia grisea]TLD12950.1 hypothetical protein PgNI_02867 [Pyricularia grisea]
MRALFIVGLATFTCMPASAEQQGFDAHKVSVRKGVQPAVAMIAPQLVPRVNPPSPAPASVAPPKPPVPPASPGIDSAPRAAPKPGIPPPQPPNTGSDNGPPPSANSPGRSAGLRVIDPTGFGVFALAVAFAVAVATATYLI